MTIDSQMPEKISAWPHNMGMHEGHGSWNPDGCTLQGNETQYIRGDTAHAMAAVVAQNAMMLLLEGLRKGALDSEMGHKIIDEIFAPAIPDYIATVAANASKALADRDKLTWSTGLIAAHDAMKVALEAQEADGNCHGTAIAAAQNAIAALNKEPEV